MSLPYYVAPDQIIADKAEFARKGITRGRSVVVISAADGIFFVADNPSRALHKISEIYDRIGFAAVGKYNEFEALRVAGIRLADMRGYSYDRTDVTVRTIANAYAQSLGSIFIEAPKPYEVEIAVAQVGSAESDDQLYRISFDGSVHDETGFIAMGGDSAPIIEHLRENWRESLSEVEAISLGINALSVNNDQLEARSLEVAVLSRNRLRRTFNRIDPQRVSEITR